MKNRLFLFGALSILIAVAAAPAGAATVFGDVIVADEGWPEGGFPNSFAVDDTCANDAPGDNARLCCLFNGNCQPGPYHSGDIVFLNTYWNDIVSTADCADWGVTWTLGVKPGPGPPIFLFRDEPLSFGDLCDFHEVELTFCIGGRVELPTVVRDGVGYGYGVTTPNGSSPLPAALGSFDVVAGSPHCTPD